MVSRREFFSRGLLNATKALQSKVAEKLVVVGGPEKPSAWIRLGTLRDFALGKKCDVNDGKQILISDAYGFRVYDKIDKTENTNEAPNRPLEVRNTNEIWMNSEDEWSRETFLCHMTLE